MWFVKRWDLIFNHCLSYLGDIADCSTLGIKLDLIISPGHSMDSVSWKVHGSDSMTWICPVQSLNANLDLNMEALRFQFLVIIVLHSDTPLSLYCKWVSKTDAGITIFTQCWNGLTSSATRNNTSLLFCTKWSIEKARDKQGKTCSTEIAVPYPTATLVIGYGFCYAIENFFRFEKWHDRMS